MSQTEAIYHALLASGKAEWTLAELIVTAWKARPDLFGLPGFDHPDSCKIVARISGKSRGMVFDGELVKLPGKRYRLGRLAAHPKDRVRARGTATVFLDACASTIAARLSARSLMREIERADAAELWRCCPVGGEGSDMERFRVYLDTLDDDDERVRTIKSLHNYCVGRFGRQLGKTA